MQTTHINHKWDKSKKPYTCIVCGLQKFMAVRKTLMAIHKGKDVYKYDQYWVYIPKDGKEQLQLPSCIKN